MTLDPQDRALFFKIYIPLLGYIRKCIKDIPGLQEAEETTQVLYWIREAMCKNTKLIQGYVAKNPDGLGARELAIVESWQRFIHGQFVCLQAGKRHVTLLHWEGKKKMQAYHVLGITDPISTVAEKRLLLRNILLLPWEGKIIWDGIVPGGIFLGSNIWRGIQDDYRQLKQKHKVINVL